LSRPQGPGAIESASSGPSCGDRREVFAWALYAWAFHGFVTTVATVLLGPYLTGLAQAAVGDNGPVFGPRVLPAVTAKAFFFHCVSVSVFLQMLALPFLGAIADYTSAKKQLLAFFSSVGASATCLLFFVGAGLDFRWGGALFVVANLSFGASIVFYNAFLPEIVSEDQRDRISSRGYALGYLGGGLLLSANLVFMRHAPRLGLGPGFALRLCLLSAGLWWAGFSLPMLRRLKTRRPVRSKAPGARLFSLGLSQLSATFRELRGRPQTRRFLIAYLLFNDGIQTVISVAAVFLAQELFVAQGRPPDQSFLLGVMLMVQFVAVVGALIFERLAAKTCAKHALVISLVLWSGVVIYGYRFLRTTTDAFWMSAIIALVLGGSQALSRSLFSRMIPLGREASFFALYELSESGTSWIGPFIFALVVAGTNSYRQALLSLIALFVTGTLLLILTDVERAFAEAHCRVGEPGGGRPSRAARRPSWRRLVLDAAAGRLATLALQVFFREVKIKGLEGIPEGVPLVFVANHNNSVVDSFLLLALPRARPRLLAKSPLFSHPVMRPLLALAGALPVYRHQDAGTDVSRNTETFSRCHEILAAGGSIALFPEGSSHNSTQQLPVKTGAARIVLEAEARFGPLGVRVVPIGLGYESKGEFRSNVAVQVGAPIDPKSEVALYRDRKVAAVRGLTDQISAGLETAQRLAAGGREEPSLAEGDRPNRRLRDLLGLPILLVGSILNWLPYRIPAWVSRRLSRTPDEPATYKLLTGLLAFPLAWTAEAGIAACLAGPAWGLAVAIVAPATGYATLKLREDWNNDGKRPVKPFASSRGDARGRASPPGSPDSP
jgi:UMF1 family MFS transporter